MLWLPVRKPAATWKLEAAGFVFQRDYAAAATRSG
jgi:hypothetical protein